ncbi:MAG: hypothetical protein QOC93_3136 [Actinomycetota bacterium]|nr:hypothetical protein [Actinomycetota bacterium]
MAGKRVSRTRRRSAGKGFAALVAAALVVAGLLGWSLHAVLSNGGVFSDAPGGGSAAGRETVARLESDCASQVAAADAVVAAAQPGVTTWRVHVQARTDMLRGRISEKEMNTIWDRTKARGPAEQERFAAASDRYDGTPACDRLRSESSGGSAAARSCVERAQSAGTAASAARAAMAEWGAHLHHMETFADGGMSAGHAQAMWVAAWRKAPTNITAYEDARAALGTSPACDAS